MSFLNKILIISFFTVLISEAKIEYTFGVKFKPESFYGKNISFLNEDITEKDTIWYWRHTLDLKMGAYDDTHFVRSYFVLRNKAVWGNPASVALTNDSDVKFLGAVVGQHRHYIPRQIMWIREGWVDMELPKLLGFTPLHDMHFKLGAFPFALGRGIALGDAYAVGIEQIGFYSDNLVDQFAFGFDMYGNMFTYNEGKSFLRYDAYGAILQNKSSGLGDVAARIYGQEYGKKFDAERKFGKINFIVAFRLLWDHKDAEYGNALLEPYILYNRDPEQFVEFLGDSRSRLATWGIAFEYEYSCFEFGFDTAFNFGNQLVKGWDRNQVILQNNNEIITLVNDHVQVLDADNNILGNAPYIPNGSAEDKQREKFIQTAFQAASQNGVTISGLENITTKWGIYDPAASGILHAINSGKPNTNALTNRFRDPYFNFFKGWMFVADASVRLCKGIKLGATVGVSTGDDNPNADTEIGKNHHYHGFIPLQEIYAGKRVRSAFLINGNGRVSRPLSSTPQDLDQNQEVSLEVSGFTNLVFGGTSALFDGTRKSGAVYSVQPNVLVYWQEKAVPAGVHKYMGTELNLFADYLVTKQMKFFVIGAVFFPGALFKDLSGKPGLTLMQEETLEREDVVGFTGEPIPNLGHDTAFTVNIGIEYNF